MSGYCYFLKENFELSSSNYPDERYRKSKRIIRIIIIYIEISWTFGTNEVKVGPEFELINYMLGKRFGDKKKS